MRLRPPLVILTIALLAGCGSSSTPTSTSDAAPLAADAAVLAVDAGPGEADATPGAPCTALSVELDAPGGSMVHGTPTPGRCEESSAVVCMRRDDAMDPDRTAGNLVRTTCGSGQHCQTYNVEVHVGASADPLFTMAQATCLDDGDLTFAMAWNGSIFVPVTEHPPMCDGTDRLRAAGLTFPETRFYSATNDDLPTTYTSGALLGHYEHTSCNVGDHCELAGGATTCVADGSQPCTGSTCDGSVRHICHDGFTAGTQDCAASGLACIEPADTAVCIPASEQAAVCAPAGSDPCGPQSACTDEDHYSRCDYDTCLEVIDSCPAGQVCNPASIMCNAIEDLCDPSTAVDRCDGDTVHYCGTFTSTTLGFDCAAVGMVCRTLADASRPGGVRAGCASEPAISCPIGEPATCSGSTASWCCASDNDGNGIPSVIFAQGGQFRCLPGQRASAPCSGCSIGPPPESFVSCDL
jgi:hypothetical protein